MRLSDQTKGRAGNRPDHARRYRTAQVIWLDDYRLRRRPQAVRRYRPVALPRPSPARRLRVPIEVLLVTLILFSALVGAVFALMGLGKLP